MSGTNNPKIALIILDGWGIGQKDNSNPIYAAKIPNLDRLKSNFPYLGLQASGLAIGLPWQEEGNSEIGHLTLGAGRIVYQNVANIDSFIDNGSFFENAVLKRSFTKAKESGSSVCLVGMIGSGITHSSLKHLSALIEMADKMGVDYKLHLFTDGRDSSQKDCLNIIKTLPQEKIGSLTGRFYAMDRDGHMERVEEAFKAMVGKKPTTGTPSQYIEKNYESGVTDEFIRAASFGGENMSVKPSDSIVFFNFRKDRMRQISALFRKEFPDTEISSFTEYEINNGIPKAFSLEGVENPLAKILADRGKSQLRVAESEKSAHVTYFFDAEREDPFPREFRVIIPSKKVASHDKYPEMMAEEITTRIISALEEGSYDFILANYANADMVAHTGNFDATVKAVEILDKQIGLIADTCLKTGATLILTSDHGNAEKLIDSHTGEKDTKHNSSPVPVIVIDKRFERIRTPEEIEDNEKLTVGSLCDIAPTVLELMGIEKPAEMTGQSIIPYLQ